MAKSDAERFPIPETANVVIVFTALPATWLLLWAASHLPLAWGLLAAWAFALVNNTPFGLLHEAVHGVFSKSRIRNDGFGILCAAAFPTSFVLQTIAHLGHHRRNRTDKDLYDYYLPTQSRWLRNTWLYAGNLLGCYWFFIPISTGLYLIAPWLYTSEWFVRGPARYLGFEAYVEEIAQHSKRRIWLECLVAVSYQALLWWALDLHWAGWLLCHWAFALHWSALQYVDHAWSPRDIVNGAWNLKVHPVTRALALNYHYHLAHHRYPWVPWIHLPKLVDPKEPQPTFWSIYFSLWGGARPAPPMGDRQAPANAS
jgi:fatty acid desaturase